MNTQLNDLYRAMPCTTEELHDKLMKSFYEELRNTFSLFKFMSLFLSVGSVLCFGVSLFGDELNWESVGMIGTLLIAGTACYCIHMMTSASQRFAMRIRLGAYKVCECGYKDSQWGEFATVDSVGTTFQMKIQMPDGTEPDVWFDTSKSIQRDSYSAFGSKLLLVSDGEHWCVTCIQ